MQYKNDLVSRMENIKNNFILVMAAISLFYDKRSYPILNESKISFGTNSIDFKQVADMMKNENNRKITCDEFGKMGLRILTKESVRLIEDYCKKSGQLSKLKSQTWWQFARIISNSISHNFIFEFRPGDKKELPVTWNNKTIDLSMDNTLIGTLSLFGYSDAWKLFEEMNLFVKIKLV